MGQSTTEVRRDIERTRDDMSDTIDAIADRTSPRRIVGRRRERMAEGWRSVRHRVMGKAEGARETASSATETGAGQWGSALALACSLFGLECVVYMGEEDMRRQKPNVERMRLLGAEVRGVDFGTKTLKEATSEAIRDWITNVETTHYLIGSCVGPAPYPELVAELQSVIGREAREQHLAAEGRLPEAVVAAVGGGSNAIGIFHGFLHDADVRLVGVEAAGAAALGRGRAGGVPGARASDRPRRGRPSYPPGEPMARAYPPARPASAGRVFSLVQDRFPGPGRVAAGGGKG